jgi:hypothetical protein
MATTTRTGAQGYGDKVADTAASMAEDARDAATPIIDKVRERAQQFGAQAQEFGAQAQDTAGTMAGEAYEHGRSAVRAVNRQIEEQPLFTALAAFAIGYGLSYLLHGQR